MYVCFVNGIPSMLDNSFLFTICQTCLDSSSAVRNGAGRPGRRPPNGTAEDIEEPWNIVITSVDFRVAMF